MRGDRQYACASVARLSCQYCQHEISLTLTISPTVACTVPANGCLKNMARQSAALGASCTLALTPATARSSPLMVWTAPPPRLHSAEGPSPERHKEGDRYEKIHQNRD